MGLLELSISIVDLFAPSEAYKVKIPEKATFRESVNLLLDEPTVVAIWMNCMLPIGVVV